MVAPRPPRIDPAIEASVGDVERPRGKHVPIAAPSTLPGESGIVAGIVNVAGMTLRGVAHFLDQTRRFGPIYRTMLGFQSIVCVTDPDLIAAIARNEDQVWSTALAYRAMFDGIEEPGVPLDGLASVDFETHHQARRLIAAAFTPAALEGYLELARPLFEKEIAEWRVRGRVPFKRAARRLFARVALRIFVGLDDPADAEIFDRAIADLWRTPMVLWRNRRFGPGLRRGIRALQTLTDMLLRLVPERRASDKVDLFSRLCREAPEVSWIDDRALVRLFVSVMTAAFDTTAAGATSMAHLLAVHPDWQEQVGRECERVNASGLAREGMKQLEKLEWTWKETLRLYPTALAIPRCALREVTLGGYRLQAGTTIFALTCTALRDPRFWTNPDRFDPDRFSPARAEDRKHRGIFLPFGAGAHSCLGMQLSTMEAKAFFHALLSETRVRAVGNTRVTHGFSALGIVSGPVELELVRARAGARRASDRSSPGADSAGSG